MQFSENWLRSFVNPNLNSDELSHALTMAGLEVEDSQPAGAVFSHVVIGEIVEAAKHPDADRLQVCKVNIGVENGTTKILQIVCGAANARVGIKVPCALVGAALPGIAIKQAQVRGVDSFGMLCSSKELGLSTEAEGLLELPADAPIGADIRDFFQLNDNLLTLKLTPNRADCLSILGIARDVAAITGAPLIVPKITRAKLESQRTMAVLVNAPQECPAYYGRPIEAVNAQAKTPDWIIRNLERSGVHSISAIVDITNYVLLELGQPMHAFDLAKLGDHIEVRFAKADETLKLLNDTEVKLKTDDLVIASNGAAIALAGIMGGEPTSVTDATTDIFLESAFFTPDAIAGKARRLGLSTDSSYRFERGVDFGNTLNALERATTLILEICGGRAGSVTQAVTVLPARNTVNLRYARLLSVLGIVIPQKTVGTLLTQLGFEFSEKDGTFAVKAPSYRFDIAREEDLIEEIARLHGYDKISAIKPIANLSILDAPEAAWNKACMAGVLRDFGYQEVVTYSFVDESWERDLMGNASPIKLKNPIASNLSVMRSGLWGGLLDALTYNLNRKQERAMLFEIGASYFADKKSYREEMQISGLCYGAFQPEQWGAAARDVDFYDVKATVDALTKNQAEYRQETHSALHPGQSARVYLHNKPIGWIGKLHPKWQQQNSLPKNTVLFELQMESLLQTKVTKYQEVPKFLPVRRDIAIVVDADLPVQAIVDAVNSARINLVQQIQLFDIYQGKGIAENKKSLAFLVLMQDTHKTLLDIDAETAMAELLKLLEKQFGASLRN
jgi:phenylalanyl-tRNA synthetase beta chain